MITNVGSVCVREVVITNGTDSVLDVANLMREHHVGDVVVVEKRAGVNYPTGIITDRDIVVGGVAAAFDRLPQLVADDLVMRPLITVREEATIEDALEIMRKNGVRRIPVVDATEALVGILAVDDLLDQLARDLTSISALISREQRNERDARP
jgi:CBS domain-containing protein